VVATTNRVRELAQSRRRVVMRALAEDLGDHGDVTTSATVPVTLEGIAEVVARADGIVAGLDCLDEVFAQVDGRVLIERRVRDGDRVVRGDVVATVRGRLRSLLTGERTALNLLCHLSGIATVTPAFVDAVDGTGVVIRDTRKTTPGLRLLEKDAVVAGGGTNHRIGLYDQLLVKDNHVIAAGGAGAAARAAMERADGRPVQVEISRSDQLEEVLEAGVTDILLDNFTPAEVRHLVARTAFRASLEVSGNVRLDNVRAYADTGVDTIAVGAITHSAPWLDLAMDVRQAPGASRA
jgi:nicotinate-nucleotide pyrophosphorylase (carboxylating)